MGGWEPYELMGNPLLYLYIVPGIFCIYVKGDENNVDIGMKSPRHENPGKRCKPQILSITYHSYTRILTSLSQLFVAVTKSHPEIKLVWRFHMAAPPTIGLYQWEAKISLDDFPSLSASYLIRSLDGFHVESAGIQSDFSELLKRENGYFVILS